MNPLLAIRAASVGSDMLQAAARNIAGGASKPAAQADSAAANVKFSDVLARVSGTPEVQRIKLLRAEGIHDRADADVRLNELAQQVLQSPELRDLAGGSSGPVDLRFQPDGTVRVRTADGRERTVKLAGEGKALADEARSIIDALGAGSSRPAPAGADSRWPGPGTLRVTPGGSASLRS